MQANHETAAPALPAQPDVAVPAPDARSKQSLVNGWRWLARAWREGIELYVRAMPDRVIGPPPPWGWP
jgi:hypothetical protein